MVQELTHKWVANSTAEQFSIAKQLLAITMNGNSAETTINSNCSMEKDLRPSKILLIKIGMSKASIMLLMLTRSHITKINMVVNLYDQINKIFSI